MKYKEVKIMENNKIVIKKQRQDFCYHTHTKRCGHAKGNDDEYVRQAVAGGMKIIAFTEHVPQINVVQTTRKVRMNSEEVNSYLHSIDRLREKYKGQIEIESGFEFEYADRDLEYLRELKFKTDKMVLGQHFVVDKAGRTHVFRGNIVSDEILDLYAEAIITAIDKGLPDIIVHPERFMIARTSFGEKEKQVSRLICRKAVETEIPLEINMGEPLDKLKESNMSAEELRSKVAYPKREFWEIVLEESKKAIEEGKEPIKVVYGKDAHSPDRMSATKDYELVDKIIGIDILKELHFVKSDLKTYNQELVQSFSLKDKVLSRETAISFAREMGVATKKEIAREAISEMEKTSDKSEPSLDES